MAGRTRSFIIVLAMVAAAIMNAAYPSDDEMNFIRLGGGDNRMSYWRDCNPDLDALIPIDVRMGSFNAPLGHLAQSHINQGAVCLDRLPIAHDGAGLVGLDFSLESLSYPRIIHKLAFRMLDLSASESVVRVSLRMLDGLRPFEEELLNHQISKSFIAFEKRADLASITFLERNLTTDAFLQGAPWCGGDNGDNCFVHFLSGKHRILMEVSVKQSDLAVLKANAFRILAQIMSWKEIGN